MYVSNFRNKVTCCFIFDWCFCLIGASISCVFSKLACGDLKREMSKSIKLQEYKVSNKRISFLGIATLKSGLVSCLTAGLVSFSI